MRHTLILIFGLILVILVWIVLGYSYLSQDDVTTDNFVLKEGENIMIGNAEIVPYKQVDDKKMTIDLINGQSIEINDVRQGSVSLGDGTYVVYESPDKSTRTFEIIYFEEYQRFHVILEEEPLAEMRRASQIYLSNALGIGFDELCELNHSVMTSVYVNQTWGGAELGFEGCTGAISL
jgi:hypothetical protein